MEGAQLLMRYDEAMHPLVASLQQLSSDELLGLLKRLNLSYEQLSDVIQGVSPEKNSLVDAIIESRSSETGSSTVHAAELEPEAAPPEVAPTAAAPEATAAAAPEATPEVTPDPPAATGNLSISISNLSLKDEDRACTAVADVCGEAIELLLVADGHGGPEVREVRSSAHIQCSGWGWGLASKCRCGIPRRLSPLLSVVAQRASALCL